MPLVLTSFYPCQIEPRQKFLISPLLSLLFFMAVKKKETRRSIVMHVRRATYVCLAGNRGLLVFRNRGIKPLKMTLGLEKKNEQDHIENENRGKYLSLTERGLPLELVFEEKQSRKVTTNSGKPQKAIPLKSWEGKLNFPSDCLAFLMRWTIPILISLFLPSPNVLERFVEQFYERFIWRLSENVNSPFDMTFTQLRNADVRCSLKNRALWTCLTFWPV